MIKSSKAVIAVLIRLCPSSPLVGMAAIRQREVRASSDECIVVASAAAGKTFEPPAYILKVENDRENCGSGDHVGRQGGRRRDRAFCGGFGALVRGIHCRICSVRGRGHPAHPSMRVSSTRSTRSSRSGPSSRRRCSHRAPSRTSLGPIGTSWCFPRRCWPNSRPSCTYAASSTPHCPTLCAGYLCGWGRTARPGRAGSGWLPPRAAAPSCCSTERSTAGSRPTWPPYGPAGTGSRGSHPASPMSALRRVRRVHLRVHQSQVSSYRVNAP